MGKKLTFTVEIDFVLDKIDVNINLGDLNRIEAFGCIEILRESINKSFNNRDKNNEPK